MGVVPPSKVARMAAKFCCARGGRPCGAPPAGGRLPSGPRCQQAHWSSSLCQWNRHGYDVAKIFGGKFTHVAPVWLQLRRHGREMFEVTGLDDVDQGSDPSLVCARLGSGRASERASVCVCEDE